MNPLQALDMHLYLPLAAFLLVPSFLFVTAAPLTATPLSSIVTTNSQGQPSSHDPLILTSSSLNESSSPSQQPASARNLSSLSNATLISPQGLIPYPVKGTPTTLFFHHLGAEFPSAYMLQCLSLSLTLVLEVTLDGRGNDLITNGYFTHKHILPSDDNVTITVADFREIGKPMNYNNLRDTLSGIGDFVTEPGQKVRALGFEIDVERKGYVGTGHVDYEPAMNSE